MGAISAAALFSKAKTGASQPKVSDSDRALQKQAAKEALDTARASLKDGSNVNPSEMASALEGTMREIAGEDEPEEEDETPKPKGKKKKPAEQRSTKTPSEDDSVDLEALRKAVLIDAIDAVRRAAEDAGFAGARVTLL